MEGQTGRSAEKAGTATLDPKATLRASADCKMSSAPLTYLYRFGILEPVSAPGSLGGGCHSID